MTWVAERAQKIKIKQLADDTTLFLKNKQDRNISFAILMGYTAKTKCSKNKSTTNMFSKRT